LKLLNKYKGLAVLSVQDGSTCFLWLDNWDQHILRQHFPELFSFCGDRFISLKAAVAQPLPHDLFHQPLSSQAYAQFQQLV
jgi:hypothetical protein